MICCSHFIDKLCMNVLSGTRVSYCFAYNKKLYISEKTPIYLPCWYHSVENKFPLIDHYCRAGIQVSFFLSVLISLLSYSGEVKIISMMLTEMLTWGVWNKSFWIINETTRTKSDDSMEVRVFKRSIIATKF